MKLLFRLVVNTFGYGFVLSQVVILCLEFISQKETCLLLKNLFDLLLRIMEDIVYSVGGTWYVKPAMS